MIEQSILTEYAIAADAAHATAIDKGWWDTPRSFGECIALLHSELAEVHEAIEEGIWSKQAEGYQEAAIELIDYIIRIMDMDRYFKLGVGLVIQQRYGLNPQNDDLAIEDSADALLSLHKFTAQALEAFRVNNAGHHHVDKRLAIAVKNAQSLAWVFMQSGQTPLKALQAKMKYNVNRPYRHGGKAL
jgi:hypothetical protein